MPDVSLLPGICSVLKISGNQFLGTEESLVENGSQKMEREIREVMFAEPLEYQILSYDKVLFEGKVESADEQSFQTLIDKTVEICYENYDTILNKQLVKTMVDNMKALYPGVVEGLIPERVSYLELLQYLRKKVRETHNIHDMIHILEELENSRLSAGTV